MWLMSRVASFIFPRVSVFCEDRSFPKPASNLFQEAVAQFGGPGVPPRLGARHQPQAGFQEIDTRHISDIL